VHDEATRLSLDAIDDDKRLLRKKLEVRNPSVGEARLGLREGVGLVSDEILDEDEDIYSPLPTPTPVVQQFSSSSEIPLSLFQRTFYQHNRGLSNAFRSIANYRYVTDTRIDKPAVGLARVWGSVRPKSTVLELREGFVERNRGLQSP